MTSTVQLVLVAIISTVSVLAYYRSRSAAKRAEAAAKAAREHAKTAHASATAAQDAADRASLDQ